MSTNNKLVTEIIEDEALDPISWAARFAELSLAERLDVVRDCRAYAAASAPSKKGGNAIKVWEINFALRTSPLWAESVKQVALELDPPDAVAAEGGDDERSRALQIDRVWVQARSRRGFVLDGSPGAWRPSQGTPAAAASGAPRPAPAHHAVSQGTWSSARLMSDALLKRDKTRRNRLSMKPGQRAAKW
jgi:hypothetical protein